MIKKFAVYDLATGKGSRLINVEESILWMSLAPGEGYIVVPLEHMNPNFEVIDNLIVGDPVYMGEVATPPTE